MFNWWCGCLGDGSLGAWTDYLWRLDITGRSTVYCVDTEPVRHQCRQIFRHHASIPVRYETNTCSHGGYDRCCLELVCYHQHSAVVRKLERRTQTRTMCRQSTHRISSALMGLSCRKLCIIDLFLSYIVIMIVVKHSSQELNYKHISSFLGKLIKFLFIIIAYSFLSVLW